MNNISIASIAAPQVAQHFSILSLPFVNVTSNWVVAPSGDYEKDYAVGRGFASRLIRAIRAGALSPFVLSDIVTDMPGEKGPIENGFLSGILLAAY